MGRPRFPTATLRVLTTQLLAASRIAIDPQAGRKVFTLQSLVASDEPFDDGVGKVAGVSLYAGVSVRPMDEHPHP